jgi:glycerol-3-phosphate dehydrogenase (NAD(P)+)
MMRKISIIGDGGWGTTLAIHLSKKGHEVMLWSAFKSYAATLRRTRKNTKFLPGIKIPKAINITSEMQEAIEKSEIIVLAVPSCYVRKVLLKIKKTNYKKRLFLSVSKGIEEGTHKRVSEIIYNVLGKINLSILSGPNIAYEVARGYPATCVIASKNIKHAKMLQRVFTNDKLRVYSSNDLCGVELGGSLKNIIAIAAGISDGLGFKMNAKAAIVTRGLVEMARFGVALGAKKETFNGLSGIGDLVTTCMSGHSRNHFVGQEIGKGKKLRDVIKHMDMVAEGVKTTKSVYELNKKHKINMPITTEIYKVLYKNKTPLEAVNDLMLREKKMED